MEIRQLNTEKQLANGWSECRLKLLESLAKRIVEEVTVIVKEEVIVVNRDGRIIAASDPERLGNYHEGAMLAIKRNKKMIIRKQDVSLLQGVKPGLNLPLSFNGMIVGVIGITGEPETMSEFAQLIQRMTELIIQETYSSERLESKYRGLETLVYEWSHLQYMDKGFIEKGEILGISMGIARICVVIEGSLTEEKEVLQNQFAERDTTDLLRRVFLEENQHFVIRWGRGRIVILCNYENLSLNQLVHYLASCKIKAKQELKVDLAIGVGRPTTSSRTFRHSYQDSVKALQVAKKHYDVIYYGDLALDVALAEISDETRKSIIGQVLGGIIGDHELMSTLKVFFMQERKKKKTAEILHIHINTLHYRLKRISQLTGKSFDRTDDIVYFYLAISFYDDIG